ncbi:MAG: hypothetical protein J6K05_02800 [Bacteroidaceae bacterium]|nr:hypothetical protein [Bacteroidaceae bacterium]
MKNKICGLQNSFCGLEKIFSAVAKGGNASRKKYFAGRILPSGKIFLALQAREISDGL